MVGLYVTVNAERWSAISTTMLPLVRTAAKFE